MLLVWEEPSPSPGSSVYWIRVRRVYETPLRLTVSDCAMAPEGMPPEVPTELYERLRIYSMRSSASAMAPARALLWEPTSTESLKTPTMPVKTRSIRPDATTVSMRGTPGGPVCSREGVVRSELKM